MREFNLTLNTNSFVRELAKTTEKHILIYGSAGSGKSVGVMQYIILESLITKYFNALALRKVHGSVGPSIYNGFKQVMGGFRDKSDEYFGRELVFKGNNYSAHNLDNDNLILTAGIKHADTRENIKSWTCVNGQLTLIWLEEATQFTLQDHIELSSRLRGNLPKGMYFKLILTFNTPHESHWIRDRFSITTDSNGIDSTTDPTVKLFKVNIESNIYRHPDDIAEYAKLKDIDYNQWLSYSQGLWSIKSSENSIVQLSRVIKYRNNVPEKKDTDVLSMGLDPARFGKDSCSIRLRRGHTLIDRWNGESTDTDDMLKAVLMMLTNCGFKDGELAIINIDAGGGSGIIDALRKLSRDKTNKRFSRLRVNEIHFGGTAKRAQEFDNIATEMYFELAENLTNCQYYLMDKNSKKCLDALTMRTFTYKEKQFTLKAIQPKKEFKKLTHCEVDDADAIVLMNYNVLYNTVNIG